MKLFKRRRTTRQERLTPCGCCNWPLTERHHLLEFSDHGENNYTVQLCPNCHDLYHIIWNAYIEEHDITRDPFNAHHRWLLNSAEHHLNRNKQSHIVDYLNKLAQFAHELKRGK